nr:MAG TPA: Histone H1-like nucleoprotein HC2 [Caudoviricetes sp.]
MNKSELRLICNRFVRDRIQEQIRHGLRQQYMPLISRNPAIDAGFFFFKARYHRSHRV